MRFKLDENLGARFIPFFAEGGHDVDTVLGERLLGKPDETIYAACVDTERALVTLDLDFSNPFRYPPAPTKGIVVVRPPRQSRSLLLRTILAALPALKAQDLKGCLWIVEPGRIRVYDPGREGEA